MTENGLEIEPVNGIREFTILGVNLDCTTKTVITEIKAVKLCSDHNLNDFLWE